MVVATPEGREAMEEVQRNKASHNLNLHFDQTSNLQIKIPVIPAFYINIFILQTTDFQSLTGDEFTMATAFFIRMKITGRISRPLKFPSVDASTCVVLSADDRCPQEMD